jgi:hypothetical protein
MIMKNVKIIYVWLIVTCLGLNSNAFADVVQRWQEVPAVFTLKKTSIDTVKPHTVVGRLIEMSKKNVINTENADNISNIVDADGKTIEYFMVTYKIPVNVTGSKATAKTKTVTQYGLYRTISTDLRAALSKHHTPLHLRVRYYLDSPTSFDLIVGDTLYITPTMVMDM